MNEVRHIMRHDAVTMEHDYTVAETAQFMIDFALETIIITMEDEILGSINYRDILEHLLSRNFDPHRVTIGEIADETIILVRPTTSLNDATQIMIETDRSTLPVVDDQLVGYIRFTDVLEAIYMPQPEPDPKPTILHDPHYYIV